MKNKKKGLLHIIVILAVIALCSFTTLVGFTKAHKGSARNIKLGLDLAGGVSITYDVVGDKPTDAELKDTVTMMQKRAEVHSTESSVVTDEKGRIVIDIPGVDDAEKVLSDLGKEGSLDFVAQDDMDLSSGKPVYTKTICTGKDIKSAEAGTTQDESTKTKKYVVSLKFKSKGTKAFATATEEAAPSHKMIYIVYDGKVISNPGVTEAITNGEAQISGGFKTYDEAEELASYIRIGALPVELKAAQSQVVGAQLGLDAIQSSRCDRFWIGCIIYDYFLSSARFGIFYRIGVLFGTDVSSFECLRYYTDTSWYRRYHIEYRYGGRCERNYLYAY